MPIIDFRDVAELVNQSRTTRLEMKPTKAKEGRWAMYPGVHLVHTSQYPFRVLYFQSSATLEDIRAGLRDTQAEEPVHIVYPPSLQRLIQNNVEELRLRDRAASMWTTKDYILSFIREEIDTYLNRLKSLRPVDYINPRIETPSGFQVRLPNPVLSFLVDPSTVESSGRLGIVLAEPGQGKTYMSTYLVSQLATGNHGVVPLMVDSSQWQGLSVEDQRSLPKTIAHSFRHFGAAIGWLDGHEDLFLRSTLKADIFRIIFDGFDEYILHNRGSVSPLDVLEVLADLAATTGTRIVITSRTSFWHSNLPLAEVEDFVRERGAFVFSILPFNRENAKNYFDQRIAEETQCEKALQIYDVLRQSDNDLIGRGFVLSLIADLAMHGGSSPHPGYDSARAMLWLLEALCQREEVRQDLPFTAKEQLEVLRQFACEIALGIEPTTELLSLILSYVKPALSSALMKGTIDKLVSHPLLSRERASESWSFRQMQIWTLLLADYIVHLPGSNIRDFVAKVHLSPGAMQDVAEMIVQLAEVEAASQIPLDRLGLLISAMSERGGLVGRIWGEGSRLAGLIVLGAVDRTVRAGSPRTERTELLRKLGGGATIFGITFTGVIAHYDFSGTEFRNCRFERVTWVNCKFTAQSAFVQCEFIGGNAQNQCEGMGSARLENCSLDPDADTMFSVVKTREGKKRYSAEDLRRDISSVIDKFVIKGGLGLKSVAERHLTRGTIATSRHRDDVISALKSKIFEEHEISGVGSGYHIRENAVEAVKFYAANNVFTGPLRTAYEALERKITEHE
ncbi:NACHT domain-containing protein [Pseudacidobacterium ailaaui]|jgi:hypothetical protein|uniref:NACHT domain-containing protein n=1 Tax=Pseudacidobacterium ailaaui TaxID=1382359 RepID=UPI00047DAB64|nr:hypothetical protein [Pseudacidobacterium ailaaui]